MQKIMHHIFKGKLFAIRTNLKERPINTTPKLLNSSLNHPFAYKFSQ
jgi:hypothetical protein